MVATKHPSAVSRCCAPSRSARVPLLRTLLIAAIGALCMLGAAAAPALAAKPAGPSEHAHGKGGEAPGGGGGGSESLPSKTGADISYPQCGTAFPEGQAFGIVGVNGGLANDPNPCLGPDPGYKQSELYWAAQSSGEITAQAVSSLYVNTADPGNVYNNAPIADWPTSGGGGSYGACQDETVKLRGKTYLLGKNSPACAWQYGFQRAQYDMGLLAQAATSINGEAASALATGAGGYPWWLDVETANTWQSGAEGQAMNRADLQGMVEALKTSGAQTVGIYSTEYQWGQVTGGGGAGALYQLPVWIPGASSIEGAIGNCSLPSFTGGTAVSLTQWLDGSLDADHYCL